MGESFKHQGEPETPQTAREGEVVLGERPVSNPSEVAQLSAELEQLRQDQVKLLYTLSHDLRAPLRIASSFGELLRSRYGSQLDSRGGEYLAHALNAIGQLSRRLDALLVLSRLNTVQAEARPVSLNEVFEGIVQHELAGRIRDSHATITIGELPSIRGDTVQLRQLALQLLSNALTFHAEGLAPEVTITAAPPSSESVGFCVVDNGIGIAPKFQSDIFDLFRRLHPPGEYTGEGAGLTIARRIVDLHGGTITCSTRLPAGSIFTVSFPRSGSTPPPP
jgi:light-regulated signal transduction histidine kinase (bacteriophytochrome)